MNSETTLDASKKKVYLIVRKKDFRWNHGALAKKSRVDLCSLLRSLNVSVIFKTTDCDGTTTDATTDVLLPLSRERVFFSKSLIVM
jgi:hypothetical protein